MAGFDHTPGPKQADADHAASSARARNYGLLFFAVYLLLYGGFVLLNALAPGLMEELPFAGVNLAVLYGLALIVVAFVLALLYDWLCLRGESEGQP